MISIWLTPAKEDAAYLQNIINELTSVYRAPVFSPHMTLLSPVDLNVNELGSVLTNVAQEITPLFVTMSSLNHTNNIWKTVFIELEESLELVHLQQGLVSQFPSAPPYEFLPHISLIYKEMLDEQKEDIICNLSVRNSYKMDKIIVMRTGPNVDQWEKVLEVKLNA